MCWVDTCTRTLWEYVYIFGNSYSFLIHKSLCWSVCVFFSFKTNGKIALVFGRIRKKKTQFFSLDFLCEMRENRIFHNRTKMAWWISQKNIQTKHNNIKWFSLQMAYGSVYNIQSIFPFASSLTLRILNFLIFLFLKVLCYLCLFLRYTYAKSNAITEKNCFATGATK